LTNSIIADTAVFNCCRCSMSTVTRRMVSCVFRRIARSAGVNVPGSGIRLAPSDVEGDPGSEVIAGFH